MKTGRRRCFIAHWYKDPARDLCLRRRLPGRREPFIFPPIEASPGVAVSDGLMEAIEACEALVYLDTRESLATFWVGFERNYAARLGKPIYAFRPGRRWFPFKRDNHPAMDPVTSVMFNLQVDEDRTSIQSILERIWEKHRFDFRGVGWRRLDNEPRQMLDSIEDMSTKIANGGIVLLFLSNASICAPYHDYADPFAYQRAKKDLETPIGLTARKFASIPPDRMQVVWLDEPDRPRIEAALARFDPDVWQGYLRVVRAAIDEPRTCVAWQTSGALNRNALDDVLVRTFWLARQADPVLAADFRARLVERPREPQREWPAHRERVSERAGVQ
jgi:hypothetical protein